MIPEKLARQRTGTDMTTKVQNFLTEENYVHPFTRTTGTASKLTVTPWGEICETPVEKPVRKLRLTDEDIVNYYYKSVGLEENNPLINRDRGSVRWLVSKYGLDRTLFALDSLIESFVDGDNRSAIAPPFIECANHIQLGDLRYGEVEQIARQYGVSSC